MCHQLEVLNKIQWTSIFQLTNEYKMLQNHEWVKDPFEMQDRKTDFKIPEHEKFIDMVSDSMLQLIFFKTATFLT